MSEPAANVYVAVVEDDESLSRSLARLLRASGMQVVTYGSAEHYLADGKQPKFDCLVLDLQMSGASGVELNERLAAGGSRVPVIYLTAHHEPEVRDLAMQTPCAAFLRKTESGDVVLAAIRSAIATHRAGF